MGLALLTAAGRSLAQARILAGLPREIDGDTFGRVWLCAIRGDGEAVEVVEALPFPVARAWMSENGTLYLTCQDGFVAVGGEGRWEREPLRHEGCPPQRIFGFSGKDARDDLVFTSTDRALHIRRGGVWETHPYPDDVDMAAGLHGLSPDAVYVCTAGEGLHKWNGRELEFVDMPYPEEPSGVLVLPGDDLVVTADDIHLRSGGEWTTPPHPGGKPTIAVAGLGPSDDLFVGTREGILRRRGGGTFELAVPGYCNMLAGVGDAVLGGKGFDGFVIHVYDGTAWRTLALPSV